MSHSGITLLQKQPVTVKLLFLPASPSLESTLTGSSTPPPPTERDDYSTVITKQVWLLPKVGGRSESDGLDTEAVGGSA